jgi:PhnB protein
MASAPKPTASQGASKHANSAPEGCRTIAPYLIVRPAAKFIDFVKAAFDAKERMRFARPDQPNLIMHAEVSIGDSVIELADATEQYPPARQALHLYVDDADSTYERALQAGATSIYPVADQPWGDRQGTVRDAFGNIWYIGMPKTWKPEDHGIQSVQPFLLLHGADKMISFLQNAFGAQVLGDVPKSPEGNVLHATIQIGDSTLELADAYGEFQPMPCHLHLHINDADVMYAQALKAGAVSIDAPSNKPYGRSAGVKDAFGNSWFVTSPLSPQS